MKSISVYAILILTIIGGIFLCQNTAQAVTISQYTIEVNARPGETIELVNQLYDDAFTGVIVYPWVFNFTEDPVKEGAAIVLTDPKDLKPDREWIKYDDVSIELPVEGTLVDFPYRIEVPQDAEPGTHLISIVYRTQPPKEADEEGAVVYVGTNVVTNIFLRVLGATVDEISAEFQSGVYTQKDENLAPSEQAKFFKPKWFFLKSPVDFLLTVDNTGNTHQKPDGNVKIINDIFGTQFDKILINPENRIVLPGEDRTYAVDSFGQGFMFGKFRAQLTLLYGDPLRPLDKEIIFWIVPLVEILIASAVLILIIFFWWYMRRRRKKKEEAKEKKMKEEILQAVGKSGVIDQKKLEEAKIEDKPVSVENEQSKKHNKKFIVTIVIIGVLVVGGGATAAFMMMSGDDVKTINNNLNTNANINNNANNTNTPSKTYYEEDDTGNSNTEININSNVEGNTNANTNGNININDNTNVPPTDTDGDGLNDDEETQYGTDLLNPDSDGDGYLDGSEVRDGYNPNGEGPLPV